MAHFTHNGVLIKIYATSPAGETVMIDKCVHRPYTNSITHNPTIGHLVRFTSEHPSGAKSCIYYLDAAHKRPALLQEDAEIIQQVYSEAELDMPKIIDRPVPNLATRFMQAMGDKVATSRFIQALGKRATLIRGLPRPPQP